MRTIEVYTRNHRDLRAFVDVLEEAEEAIDRMMSDYSPQNLNAVWGGLLKIKLALEPFEKALDRMSEEIDLDNALAVAADGSPS